MQTEVLRLIHPDYEVIVRTQDISYSWERFKGRINYSRRDNPDIDAPETYCRYTSKDECELRLYTVQLQGRKLKTKKKQNLQRARFGISYGLSSLKLVNIKFAYYSMV
jgi:hypothetical protein